VIHEIVLLGEPVLRTEAVVVTVFDDALRALVRDLFETMYHAEGIGLAAPQIARSMRVIVIDLRRPDQEEDDHRIALVNPEVTWSSDETHKQSEGCLSIPGLEEIVHRPASVRVEGYDPDGNEVVIEADDLYARALQHEIDHINGILFLDRVSPLKRRILLKKWKKQEAEGS